MHIHCSMLPAEVEMSLDWTGLLSAVLKMAWHNIRTNLLQMSSVQILITRFPLNGFIVFCNWCDTSMPVSHCVRVGYIVEKNIYEQNPVLPRLRHRINDDVSYPPAPYRILKSMLRGPGFLSGYTFHLFRAEDVEPGRSIEEMVILIHTCLSLYGEIMETLRWGDCNCKLFELLVL